MKKIFEWITGDVFKAIGGVVDDLVTTDEERIKLKNELYNVLLKLSLDTDKLRASIIEVEAKGNFLQRSWRPIVMLVFAFIVVFQYALYPILLAFDSDLPTLPIMVDDFWNLLVIGMGGYIVGRTAEKIVPNLKITKEK